MQESLVQFLSEECAALTDIIHAGIVTGTNKWETLLSSSQSQLDSLTAAAINSYESAKNAAQELGRDGEGSTFQLDVRIAKLSGSEAPVDTQVQNPTTETAVDAAPTPKSKGSGGAFSTPQDLVEFINNAMQSLSPIQLSNIYETKSNEHNIMLGKLQSLLDNMIELSNTINSSFGEGTSNSIAILSETIIPDTIDPNSIVMDGEDKATLQINAVSITLIKTDRGWLIDFESQAKAEGLTSEEFVQIDKLSGAFKKVQAQIESGEIADKGQIEFAIMTSMM